MRRFAVPRPSIIVQFAAACICLTLLSGCAGAIVGVGATVGVAAYQERGIEGVARDTKLATQIRTAYLENDSTLATIIGIEVYESRAMLTGYVDNEDDRANAVRLAWSIDGIKEVFDEIQLKSEGGFVEFAYDSWISAQLQAKMTFDENILTINYSIETVNGTVYLLGIAQNQAELDLVIGYARGIDRVRRVISHVRVKDSNP